MFHDPSDYEAFTELMVRSCERLPMRILGWCLMPNHFHFILWPLRDGDLGRWMHWLLTAHVQRHRRRHLTVGRIWQGRFHAPPIQRDNHLFTVMRYVERNPLRAGLVERAQDWPWSSLRNRIGDSRRPLLTDSPLPLPDRWIDVVNEALTEAELAAVRESLRRGKPYGDAAWTRGTAERLGLLGTLRRRGRPRRCRPTS